jgi:hypothetical protein
LYRYNLIAMQKPLMFLAALCTLLLSCSSAEEKKTEPQSQVVVPPPPPVYDTFETGKVINPVFLKGDSTIAYALYLPSAYTTKKKYPVIFFFDPHAAGHIPVERYKDLAEKYGFVILGSHSTENGMKMDITNSIVTKMMADVSARIAIDPARIYTCGFSGGSRVASTYAIVNGGVNGVIACGAGLGTKQPPKQKFSFLAVAGNEDFNYTELKALDNQLSATDWKHFFLEFDGKHEWPPVSTMDEAFVWLQVNAIRDGLLPANDSLLVHFKETNEKYAKQQALKKNLYEEYRTYWKLFAFTADTVYSSSATKMEKRKELINVLNRKSMTEKKEDSLKQMYSGSLQNKDLAWWGAQVNQLNKEIKTGKDKDEVLIRKRILSYLSLLAYSSANGAIKFKDASGTGHFLSIYELVDPTNPEHAYLRAGVYARDGMNEQSITSLRKAVSLGFSDLKRLMSDKDLMKLSAVYPDFRDLLEKVKENLKTGK